MYARDLIKDGQTALVLFTDGSNFDINEGRFDRNGNWNARDKATADKVIIYFRNKVKKVNEVFVADLVKLHHSQDADLRRSFAIEFKNTVSAGLTDSNWLEFTGSKRGASSPVRYLK